MNTRRATIYLDSDLHKALRIKAAETDRSVSDLVNTAVRRSLAEDAVDLAVFEDRVHEPTVAFEDVLRDLKSRGKL
jgi:plasmid stability protein